IPRGELGLQTSENAGLEVRRDGDRPHCPAEAVVGVTFPVDEFGAVRALSQVRLKGGDLVGVEFGLVGDVEARQELGGTTVHVYALPLFGVSGFSRRGSSCWRRKALARARRDITVPIGNSIWSAMSRYEKSSK